MSNSTSEKADIEPKKQRHASGDSAVSQSMPVPPDGGYGWVITFASFFNHVIVDGFAFTFGVFLPRLKEYYDGAGVATIALVGSLMAGTYFLGAPIGSALINKFGCRKVCVFGGVWAGFWFAVSSFSPNIYFLLVTYGILGGLGLGFIYLPSIISVTYYFHKRRALATGLAVCGAGVGTFLFAPIGEYLLRTYDWKGALLIEAGIILNGSVFGSLLRPLTPPRKKKVKKSDTSDENKQLLKNDETTKPKENGKESTVVKYESDKEAKAPSAYGGNDKAKVQIIVSPSDDAGTDASVENAGTDKKKLIDFDNPSRLSELKSQRTSDRKAASVGDVRFIGNTKKAKEENSSKTGSRTRIRTNSESNEKYSHPLYRKDIFLSGSLLHVAEFRSSPDIRTYLRETTEVPEEDNADGTTNKSSFNRSMKAALDTLKTMLDFTLFADPIFVLACIANVLAMFALFLPFIFIVDLAKSKGVEDTTANYLLSVIGITNTLARVVIGLAALLPWVNTLIVHNASLILMGVALIINMFCLNFVSMSFTAGLFGVGLAGFISLTSVILCNLIGLQKLTNAFGLLTMFRGAAVIAGPPVAGMLYQQTQDYDIVFHIAGGAMIIAGLVFCCVHLPFISVFRFDVRQQKKQEQDAL